MNSLPHAEQIFMLLLIMFPPEMLTFSTDCSGASLSFLTQQLSRSFTTNTICTNYAIACIRVFNAGQFVTKCDCFALLDCSAVFTFPSKNSSCHLIYLPFSVFASTCDTCILRIFFHDYTSYIIFTITYSSDTSASICPVLIPISTKRIILSALISSEIE